MIRYKKTTNNIATLTLRMEGVTSNILNHKVRKIFDPVINHLKSEQEKGSLKGLIITSDRKNFISGGDLEYLFQEKNAEQIFKWAEEMNAFFRMLESPGVPVVAAMNGSSLGIGFELALACHHRIAVDTPSSKFGLPEVNIGLMPGNGGVIRMLWLLGLIKSIPILTEGKIFSAKEAHEIGLVDELVDTQDAMYDRAVKWIESVDHVAQKWDKKEGRIKGGTLRTWKNANYVSKAIAQLVKSSQNNYPAKQAILSTIVEGTAVEFDTANRIGARYFTELVLGDTSKNMVKALWTDKNKVSNGLSRPKGYGKFRPRKVGIVGAGIMGTGIALQSAKRGIDVVLKDVSLGVAERGKTGIGKLIDQELISGKIKSKTKEELLGKIRTTESAKDLATCDLVIEAVFENINVKKKVLREASEQLDDYGFISSNTSSLSISELATALNHQENYIGMHFLAPVGDKKVVEIISGKNTSEETLARAFDFIKGLKKIPICIRETAKKGFFISRVINTYITEGVLLLAEGNSPAAIENIAVKSGMPIGPLASADDTSLEAVLGLIENQDEWEAAQKSLRLMCRELKRNGHKLGAGFYDYENGERSHLWENLKDHFPEGEKMATEELIEERLMYIQSIESLKCLSEGVIGTEEEANIASIKGWGFAPFKGGVIQYIRNVGVKEFTSRSKALASQYGSRFELPKDFDRFI